MDFEFLQGPAAEVAPLLIGCELERELDGVLLRVRIVETEAYDQTDAASHSYRGRTPRTEIIFGPSGFLYVYFTYGMHYCMNIVCGPEGEGAAVLIRAVEPLAGQEVMQQNRSNRTGVELTNGPAKTCQALAIDTTWSGHDMHKSPFRLVVRPPAERADIVQTTRIGISQAKDVPWRFYEWGNPYVSRL